ncbi:MAG: hypothetical protein HFH85_15515 [Lachnospiraceae bacterium]|jgi:hypothetical protein|nr:hypothetical protein [Lachnospiraceae bacterium]
MKSRLYFVLFIAYFAMVAFVMYVNGVFTGEVTSFSNLMINGVFLGIIGVLFIISIASFLRLNRLTDELEDAAKDLQAGYKEAGNKNVWSALQEQKAFFDEKNLKDAFNKFRMRVKTKNPCDIEDFINEELLEKVGSNYYNSGISGTMTGLGILGTFIGLSLGLGSFSGDDIYTISDNVGPLLSGMKVAFHTSVYGIIFSLIFNFVYRSIMADAYEKLDYFLNAFRQCAMPPSGGSSDENTAAMLVYQANLANYMKEILALAKGEARDQAKALDQMSQAFLGQIQSAMNTEFRDLGAALKLAAQSQSVNAESNKALLDAAGALVESNRSMQETINHMLERQEMFAETLKKQQEELTGACEEISRDVSTQLHTFEQMRGIYENKN